MPQAHAKQTQQVKRLQTHAKKLKKQLREAQVASVDPPTSPDASTTTNDDRKHQQGTPGIDHFEHVQLGWERSAGLYL